MRLRASQISRLRAAQDFFWATGIEDTFITAPWPSTGRTLDEYELTEHYTRWADDLALVPQCGARVMRYGLPWHRINPRPGEWDWAWADQAIQRLLDLGIEPIIDLVHYGLPGWIDRAYLNPRYPELVAEYARRVAERWQGKIFAYTPLNEPRITAWYCGRIGWWPPFERSWRGFVSVMLGVCRGIVESTHALRRVDPDILAVHVDATDLYESPEPALADEVDRRQQLVFLALDLISGRIQPDHPLWSWLQQHGLTPADADWFSERAVPLPLIGINLYPMFSRKILRRNAGRLRIAMPYAEGTIVERLAAMYSKRYDAPVFVSETASVGSVARRHRWLMDSVASSARARAAGVPLVGYTWWPLFALVTWAYRQGTHPTPYYLMQMGLWDLKDDLTRVPTPLVDTFRQLAMAAPGHSTLTRAAVALL
ncbi:MAG TPA: family 1 glycosylhydrolase [Candidatus Synoicihabitans sp.]|nr:family 1 glycosylhydrolase [Candidatus Synoicihabitans sp.]